MNKKWWIISLIVIILVGGGLFYINKKHEEARKEKEIVEMETTIVKQIKNTYSEVKKVEFIPEMSGGYDSKTGYWGFTVNITTNRGTSSPGTISYSPKQKDRLGAMGPLDSDFDLIVTEGKTEGSVTVYYSNKSKGEV